MTADWYCEIQHTIYGPLLAQALKRMAESGKLGPTDRVKKTETGKWMPASAVKGLTFKESPEPVTAIQAEEPRPPRVTRCPTCEAVLQPGAVLCTSCGLDLRTGKRHSAATVQSRSSRKRVLSAGVGVMALIVAAATCYTLVSRNPATQDRAPLAASGTHLQPLKEAGGIITKQPSESTFTTPKAAAKSEPGLPARKEEAGESASDAAKAWAKGMLVVTNPRDNLTKRILKNKDDRRVSDAIDAWSEALQEKSGNRPDRLNFVIFFHSFGPVFEDLVFQPERSDKYVRRIKSLPADAITAWEELINQVAEVQFNKNAAIISLIQFDRLFRVTDFNRAEFDLLKARARALPADSTKALAETLALGTKREQAFTELLTQDWLYRPDGSFNQDIFREALDQAKAKPDGEAGKNPDGTKKPAKTEDLRPAIRALLAQRPVPPKTDQAAQERLVKRFPNLPKSDLDAWVEALAAVTKAPADKGGVRISVLKWEPLWREEAFQPTASTQYLARVRQLPEPALARWRSAFGRIDPQYNIGDFPSKAATVLILARQERLFGGERFREDESGRLAGRYETIPRDAVKTWAEATGDHEIDAAMMLTQLDSLFDGERFQPPVLQKAVGILKEEQKR